MASPPGGLQKSIVRGENRGRGATFTDIQKLLSRRRVSSCVRSAAEKPKVSPQFQAALKALRKFGYAVGQPTIDRHGQVLITVGGRMLREEQVLERAGDETAAATRMLRTSERE